MNVGQYPTKVEQIDSNRNVVTQKDTENSMYRASNQQGSLKANGNSMNISTQNQEMRAGIYCTHHEEVDHENFNHNGVYWGQES